MKTFTRIVCTSLLFLLALMISSNAGAQSILDPSDPVVTYNASAPPTQPAGNTIGKWVRTKRLSWNTNNYKCYVYNGFPFRLRFPKSYNPTAVDGKKYPILIFFHGDGEGGPITDNEYSLFHGGQVFDAAVTNGTFDGYIFVMQTPNGFWGEPVYGYIKSILDYMITNNKLDPFRITTNGLSAGGAGVWDFLNLHDTYTSAAVPMSAASLDYLNIVNTVKYTKNWLIQGGLDGSPDPSTTQQVVTAMNNAGANLTYLVFPKDGHDTWDDTWNQPNFWPFLLNAYSSDPWTLFGRTQFCTGDAINLTVGLPPGFSQYQWRMNGVALPNTGNTITVTQLGTYDARVLRNGIWSDWSHNPVVISIKPPTVTPNITIPPLRSNVLPALDTTHGITLQVPTGYASYLWQQVGNNTTISTTNTYLATTPGNYQVKVTEQFGCSSSFSNAYTVINANGPNAPSAAGGLIITPLSKTSLRLDWNINSGQQYPQTAFEVYQGTKSGGPYTLIAILGSTVTTYTATGLNPGTPYYYVIRAVNSTAAAPASNVASGTTTADVTPPTAPKNLTVTSTTRSTVALSWSASTDDIGVVEYDVFVNGQKAYKTTATTFNVPDLNHAQSYNFAIKAKDFAGNSSPFSNQVTQEPLQSGMPYKYYTYTGTWTALANLSTLTPLFDGFQTGFQLTPKTQANNYAFLFEGFITVPTSGTYAFRTASDDGSRLYLGSLGQKTSPYNFTATPLVNNDGTKTSSSTVTSANITLTAGVYPIAVAYYSQTGTGSLTVSWKTPSSGSSFVTIPASAFSDATVNNGAVPAAPTGLTAVTQSYNTIKLSFTANSANETGIEVWRGTDAAGSTMTTVAVLPPNSTSYNDTTLNASTKYYYRLRGIGQYGQSGYSNNSPFVSATTSALPAAPAAPTNLVSHGTSTQSTVTISWTDNATNETSYQLYRSSNNNTNYLLLATLPANTITYTDAGLFSNSVFYYKVKAVNVGGSSNFSNEDSAHTGGNHPPTLNAIAPMLFMHYGTQLQVNITATDPDPGTLNLQVTGLPTAFATFTPTGNGTGTITFNNPDVTQQNVYNGITITVTDANNASVSETFSLTVNNNYSPVIAKPVANVSMNEKATSTVNISATDQNSTDVLTWSYSGLPSFAIPTAVGGNLSLALAPGYSDAGTYKVIVRVDDGNSGYDTTAFTITVASVTPPSTKVYIHFSDGSAGTLGPTPWNNTASLPTQNEAYPNLKDQNGANSGITMTVTSAWQNMGYGDGTNTYGVNTGNNSGIYPDAVLGSAWFTNNNPQIMKISGLDVLSRYNFTMLGSRGGVNDDRTTLYTIGGTTVSLQAANNSTNTVSINGMAPASDGTLTLTLAEGPNAPFGYINSLVIEKPFDDHTIPAQPRNLSGQIVNNTVASLSWTAAAYNAVNYQVYKASAFTGPYALLNPGATDPNQQTYSDPNIVQNSTYYYFVTATNGYGVSLPSDTITLTIPDLAPVLPVLSNVSTLVNQTSTINVHATDGSLDVITLQASGMPSFVSFVDNGNGNGTFTIAPTGTNAGSYTGVTLTATDNYGVSSTASFNITVGIGNMRNVFIHFNDGSSSEPAQPAPWNNMNKTPNAGAAISNLVDEAGTATSFGLSLVESWTGANNLGPTTGNNSGIYPDNVMQSFYYDNSGSARHLNITGLSTKATYNVIFYGGRGGVNDDRITNYAIGSTSVSLNAASNTTQTVQINNVSPDATGKIVVAVSQDPGAPYDYLNAMVIQYAYDTTFLAPSNLTAVSANTSSITLNWIGNAPASTTGFEIWDATSPTGPFSLLATVGSNVSSYVHSGLAKGSSFFYEVRALAGTRQSAYSNVASSSTVAYTVKIQMNDGVQNLNQGGNWNSMSSLPTAGTTVTNLINTEFQNTGINITSVTDWTGYNIYGTTTGNNTGIYPDNVMNGFYYMNYGDTATMAVSGLNLTSTYNLNFFGSRVTPPTAVVSAYQSGNKIVTLDATNNTTNVVQIAGLKPDSTGTIYFSVYATIGGGRGYLNALTIDGVPSAASNFTTPPFPQVNASRTNAIHDSATAEQASSLQEITATSVSVYPNPFVNDVNLKFEMEKSADKIVVKVVDESGQLVFVKQLYNIPQGTSVQSLGLNGGRLNAGSYFLTIQGLPGGTVKTLKLLKSK